VPGEPVQKFRRRKLRFYLYAGLCSKIGRKKPDDRIAQAHPDGPLSQFFKVNALAHGDSFFKVRP
jgi:hypothetical protein